MSLKSRERKRRIRQVEAALVEADQAISLALARIRSVVLPGDEDESGPTPTSSEPARPTQH